MSAIINVLFSHCRSNIYLIVGVCLGLSISLLFAPIELNDCQDLDEPLPYSLNSNDPVDEYEPRLNIDAKPQKAKKIPKVFIRPRYYSTELGIREKLFVGILTSPEFLHSRAVALNKTITHLVDKIRYFVSIPEATKPNVSLPGIVGFTDTKSILQPFHTLKYITDNYLEDYDYYFFIKDTAYVNARLLVEFVNKISVSQDIYMGVPSKNGAHCSLGNIFISLIKINMLIINLLLFYLDSGILLSNSIIKNVKNNLDWCVKTTYSSLDDVNFGRCITHSTGLHCSNEIQEQVYHSIKLNTTINYNENLSEISENKDFLKSITIYPLYDHLAIYNLNINNAKMELKKVQEEMDLIRKNIIKTFEFTPKNKFDLTWPIGNQPRNKAFNRFDILRWTYFNQTHVFLNDDFGTVKEFDENQKEDINSVIHETVEKVRNINNGLKFRKVVNAYWKFDSSRGIDYLFDFEFITTSGKIINKRIEVCKPLGKVEILPVPYVTENSRINMIIIIDVNKIIQALEFLSRYEDNCMNRKDKISLTIILLYDPGNISKGDNDLYHKIKKRAVYLTEKYRKDQLKVTWFSIRLPIAFKFIEEEPLLKVAIADLYVRKLSPENLILFADIQMELKPEYFNRVRMNTISQWQVYSPIPFTQYHPLIVTYKEKIKNNDFDILHNHGRYDEYNFDSISFYVRDYMTVRKTTDNKVPIVQTDKDISSVLKLSQFSKIGSIFEMFVDYSNLNTFRAVEPALKLKYKEIHCTGTKSNVTLESCLRKKNNNLGNRGQLTKLILDYKEHNDNKI
ncbi:unnamed protein product [Trichogramma brassicae]|uniref:Hexosyltransferase n=1 Tax=Trichogramma brassicae TaxID=86971 RepID=A0A6H5I1F4_9HYME|nr:unnamed protein product [Trichogramma brassicae]